MFFDRIRNSRKTRRLRKSPRYHLRRFSAEQLEDRRVLASFTQAGNVFIANLAANEELTVTSFGSHYTMALREGTWNGSGLWVNSDNSNFITLQTRFSNLLIVDDGPNTSVAFGPSTASYSSNLHVELDDPAAGTVTFTGNTQLTGNDGLRVSTGRNIVVENGARVTTENGHLMLRANQPSISSGLFAGISVQGRVETTGSGLMSIDGRGGTSIGNQFGVHVYRGGMIRGGTTGTTFVNGSTRPAQGDGNEGVVVEWFNDDGPERAFSTISTNGSNLVVTGDGGPAGHAGVGVYNGGIVSAGGNGTVTINGTGGGSSGVSGNTIGVRVGGGISIGPVVLDPTILPAAVTSSGGAVNVTGQGGSGGPNSTGVLVDYGGQITAGGTAPVTVNGTGGAAKNSPGVRVVHDGSQITSNGGDVVVTGLGGYNSDATSAWGVLVDFDGKITATGAGSVLVEIGRAHV